jgi:hypothetical protein
LTELAWNELPPEDQKEFGQFSKDMETLTKKRKMAAWKTSESKRKKQKPSGTQSKRKSTFASRATASAKRIKTEKATTKIDGGTRKADKDKTKIDCRPGSSGDGGHPSGGDGAPPAVGAEPPNDAAVGAAVGAEPPNDAAVGAGPRAYHGRNPDGNIDWAPDPHNAGEHMFHFTKVKRNKGQSIGYEVTCFWHKPELSTAANAKSGKPLPCKREFSMRIAGGANEEDLYRKSRCTLMKWCLQAGTAASRFEHTHPDLYPKGLLEPMLDEATLEENMEALCQTILPMPPRAQRMVVDV